jgi:hypothetical protein
MAWSDNEGIQFKVFSAATDLSTEVVTVADLETLGASSAILRVRVVHGKPVFEFDEKVYLNKYKTIYKSGRLSYEPETTHKELPDTQTTMETYYNLSLFTNTYFWIQSTEYNLTYPGYLSTNALAVNFKGYEVIENDEFGGKSIKYTFEARSVL